MTENGSTPLSWEERKRYREEGIEVTLPVSGLKARIRSVDLGWFLTRLNLDDLLTPLVDTLIRSASGELSKAQNKARYENLTQTEKVKEELASIKLYGEFAKFCMVHPRVVDDPQSPDEISLEDLGSYDSRWLYQRCTLPLASLKRLLDESADSVVDLADQPGHGNKAKRSNRSRSLDRT